MSNWAILRIFVNFRENLYFLVLVYLSIYISVIGFANINCGLIYNCNWFCKSYSMGMY